MKFEKYFYLFFAVSLLCSACSQVVTLNDSVKTAVDVDYSKVWSVANNQIKKVGIITKSFEKIGEIKATVDRASVFVKIKKLTERTMEIQVTAHRGILSDLDLAQAIMTSILKEL